MDALIRFTGTVLPLPARDINNDVVVPGRFLKMIDRDDARLRLALFHDWRFFEDGRPRPEFPMNRPEHQGATILLTGANFGCGSGREKAPWALLASGFRAVISTSFAEIFRSNALNNGLLPVTVAARAARALLAAVTKEPGLEVTIDLPAQEVRWRGGRASFPIDSFSKRCLVRGWDPLDYLLWHAGAISRFERTR
ncbi:MAG TPA: 3-isopropylmalate dehydratase small subunit [Kofleriaceae bacterium]|nr:3-isopropylmalate dehydratase small subunit [Kofleriaceae bacterium]